MSRKGKKGKKENKRSDGKTSREGGKRKLSYAQIKGRATGKENPGLRSPVLCLMRTIGVRFKGEMLNET